MAVVSAVRSRHPHNFGVIGSSAEQTEKNLGRISDEGMAPMDSTIIDVMQKGK